VLRALRKGTGTISSRATSVRELQAKVGTADTGGLIKKSRRTALLPRHGRSREHVGMFRRREIIAQNLWRVWRTRRDFLLPLALCLIGVAATVIAAGLGWYVGTP
jgi:hypothetical protein